LVGRPAVPPKATCLPTSSSASRSLSIILARAGFTHNCYYALNGGPVVVTFKDEIINRTSGLTVPAVFLVSAVANPAIVAVSGAPGEIATLQQDEYLTSPTADDTNPVIFTIAPIPAGRYYLQTYLFSTVPAAILTVR
jgi:hypothetical protein